MKTDSDLEMFPLEDVWGHEEAIKDGQSQADDDSPLVIKGVTRGYWVELCERVKGIRPSLRAGRIYGDGELVGEDWWLSRDTFSQYIIATCLRQPGFLKACGLVLSRVPDSHVPCFAIDPTYQA